MPEWLARLAGHIPEPGQHWTLFDSHSANRTCGARRPREGEVSQEAGEPAGIARRPGRG
jgi:hypothetical protein